jgi:hypothetical protein
MNIKDIDDVIITYNLNRSSDDALVLMIGVIKDGIVSIPFVTHDTNGTVKLNELLKEYKNEKHTDVVDLVKIRPSPHEIEEFWTDK